MKENTQEISEIKTDSEVHHRQYWLVWIPTLVFAGLLLGAIGIYSYQRVNKTFKSISTEGYPLGTPKDSKELQVDKNAIELTDYSPSNVLDITSVILENSGYVAIYEEKDSQVGSLLGQSQLLPSGASTNNSIKLSRKSESGEILYAILHKDNGDKTFELQDDMPVKDLNGEIIMVKFKVGNELTPDDSQVTL